MKEISFSWSDHIIYHENWDSVKSQRGHYHLHLDNGYNPCLPWANQDYGHPSTRLL